MFSDEKNKTKNRRKGRIYLFIFVYLFMRVYLFVCVFVCLCIYFPYKSSREQKKSTFQFFFMFFLWKPAERKTSTKIIILKKFVL